jgi:integrase
VLPRLRRVRSRSIVFCHVAAPAHFGVSGTIAGLWWFDRMKRHVTFESWCERDYLERALVDVVENYLDDRAVRFPTTAKRRSSPESGLAAWPPTAPLFVGSDGDRITRGTLQYRVLRAFRRAGIDGDRARGALVHGLRHTFAAELVDAGVSVYTVINLLGHESMVTSQR